jgi:hypothetical protein
MGKKIKTYNYRIYFVDYDCNTYVLDPPNIINMVISRDTVLGYLKGQGFRKWILDAWDNPTKELKMSLSKSFEEYNNLNYRLNNSPNRVKVIHIEEEVV